MRNKLKKFLDKEIRTKYFLHVLTTFFVASILIFALLLIGGKSLNRQSSAKATTQKTNSFANINLEAKSVLVWDVVNNRELFAKNPDEPLPLASLTKVMTAITTNDKIKNGEQIKITKEDLAPEGDSQLIVGDVWKARDLRDFTLLTSSNDGAFALATLVSNEENISFTQKMNEVAAQIGMSSSKFFNEHGLDREADRGGAYGSARDMATLFEYTLKNYPEILEVTRYKNLEFKSNAKKYEAENTNEVVDQIPNLIASKTGYTDLAGGNLVVAFDAGLGQPVIVAILGSTAEGRFTDVLQLVEASREYINQK